MSYSMSGPPIGQAKLFALAGLLCQLCKYAEWVSFIFSNLLTHTVAYCLFDNFFCTVYDKFIPYNATAESI